MKSGKVISLQSSTIFIISSWLPCLSGAGDTIAGVGFKGGSKLSRLFTGGLSLVCVIEAVGSSLMGMGRSFGILLKKNILLLGARHIVKKESDL